MLAIQTVRRNLIRLRPTVNYTHGFDGGQRGNYRETVQNVWVEVNAETT